jgi:hypothetical protein
MEYPKNNGAGAIHKELYFSFLQLKNFTTITIF